MHSHVFQLSFFFFFPILYFLLVPTKNHSTGAHRPHMQKRKTTSSCKGRTCSEYKSESSLPNLTKFPFYLLGSVRHACIKKKKALVKWSEQHGTNTESSSFKLKFYNLMLGWLSSTLMHFIIIFLCACLSHESHSLFEGPKAFFVPCPCSKHY